ncbi:twin arginine-targeting protein translocase, TatA/E family [Spongiibacter sp. IMCC21906]|jgi:sec-independent protein translocase protein TatA|uniref:twin-arginine translocase TatA/TatE family subunit n=1 Tax=Spongiibacter sp. IMCC21906 TaxID=1620392 RepID=UPI00062DCD73|nr:twin-arginine translocase TatA/TatE family subunit [Spongiibacter sp. IMCC21906]AKH70515.1 twin arginine-targeting protein translocase, TatA/E family [Spongiibacter sp. IMCC21906]
MGIGGISIWQLLIILAIVVLLFGTKRLKSLGTDLGSAIKGFKNSIQDEDEDKKNLEKNESADMKAEQAETEETKK